VNHRVHLFIRGCLTLKLSLSWKTVTCSVSDCELSFSPAGSIGMVERSTWPFSPLVGDCDSTSAILDVADMYA